MSHGMRYSEADQIAIGQAIEAGEGLIDGNIRALRTSVKTLYTQLHKEQQARQDSEAQLRDEIAALQSELHTQKRIIAQLMRERVA